MLERFVAILDKDQYRKLLQDTLVLFYVNALESKKEIRGMDNLLATPEMADVAEHAVMAYLDLRDAPQIGDQVGKSGTIHVFKNGELVHRIKGEGIARQFFMFYEHSGVLKPSTSITPTPSFVKDSTPSLVKDLTSNPTPIGFTKELQTLNKETEVRQLTLKAFLLFCDIQNKKISKAAFATLIRKSKAPLCQKWLDIHLTQFSKTLFTFEDTLDMLAELFKSPEELLNFC